MVDTILPVINQLSYLASPARLHLAEAEYNQIMSDLAALVAEALASLDADRDSLAARQAATPVQHTVTLQFYQEPRPWKVRCASPLARALLKLVQDLIALDEEWAVFAWNADQAQAITRDWPTISQVAAYESKYREWLDRLRRLRQDIRVHLKQLRQACQPTTKAL